MDIIADIILCIVAGILLIAGALILIINEFERPEDTRWGIFLIGVAALLILLVIYLPSKPKEEEEDKNTTVHIDNGNIKNLFPKREVIKNIRNINDVDLMEGYVIKFTPDSLFVFSATGYIGGAQWDSNGIHVDSILSKDFKQ